MKCNNYLPIQALVYEISTDKINRLLRKHIDETSDEQLKKKGIVQFSMSEEKRKERSRKTTTPQQKMKALALNNLSMSSRILIMKIKKKRQTKSLKGLNFASIMIKIVPKNYAD